MGVSLKRELGLLECVAYGVGIILGAGIYALIAVAADLAGAALWAAFAIGALVAMLTGLSYAELSSMFPRAAAEYVYVREALGSELLAFLVGWLILATGVTSAATVALGFAGYLREMLGLAEWCNAPLAVLLIALLSALNYAGIKESAKVNIACTLAEVLGLLVVILVGLPRLGTVNYLEAPRGLEGVLSAASIAFFAYIGFEDIANVAEETRNPERNVPAAILLAVLISAAIYVLVSLCSVSVVPWSELARSDAPLALVASRALGRGAQLLLSVIALFSTSNTVLVALIVGSRMAWGMARDGSLPRPLSLVDPRRGTPWVSILCTGAFSALFTLVGDIAVAAALASFGVFVTFLLVNLSALLLRLKDPLRERPFRMPLSVGGVSLIPLLGALSCLMLAAQFDLFVIAVGLATVVSGLPAYYALAKSRYRSRRFARRHGAPR